MTAAVMGLFGLLTVVAGGAVLFNVGDARADAGSIVPVVLWMNFLAGFLYLVAAAGLFGLKPWTVRVLLVAVVLLVIAVIGFVVHLASGEAYEQRTAFALPFRLLVTLFLYAAARYFVRSPATLRAVDRKP